MKYLISIVIIIVLFGAYSIGFYFNGKVKKPENCKKVDCGRCMINCDKREV